MYQNRVVKIVIFGGETDGERGILSTKDCNSLPTGRQGSLNLAEFAEGL